MPSLLDILGLSAHRLGVAQPNSNEWAEFLAQAFNPQNQVQRARPAAKAVVDALPTKVLDEQSAKDHGMSKPFLECLFCSSIAHLNCVFRRMCSVSV
jgi:hypothetical protein